MDAILYAVGVPYDRFELHPPMMRAAIAAAQDAGVRALIHISNVYVYGKPQTPLVAETHPLGPNTRKGRWRLEQEQLVSAAHDPAGLRTLVLRPCDFFGPDRRQLGPRPRLEGRPGRKNRRCPRTGRHAARVRVRSRDFGPIVADLFERPDAFGTAYNIAGAGHITTRAFIEQLLRAAGCPVKMRIAGANLLRVMGLFNPIMRELVEMHYLQSDPVLLDESKLRAVLPQLRKTSQYADGIAATVAAARQPAHA